MATTATLQLTGRTLTYELKSDEKGFIFRCTNETNHGLNGYHETASKAISEAKRMGCEIINP